MLKEVDRSDVVIVCQDGFELKGTAYTPLSSDVKGAVMIGPATGIKRIFYNSFATYLTENGYGVLCFDNRGIGYFTKGSINEVNASLINWGRLDMPAVLDKLISLYPHTKYHLIGHSAGGQLIGLSPNVVKFTSIFNYACSSGSIRNMTYPFKISAFFFLNIFIPLSNLIFGQANNQWVGMGEPLPKNVGNQWAKWCNGRGYIETEFGHGVHQHYFDKITIPTMWVHASDDPIANFENVKDMIRVFPHISSEIITLDPSKLGFKDIGHMKFFSSRRRTLWDVAIDWLDKYCWCNKKLKRRIERVVQRTIIESDLRTFSPFSILNL